MKKIGIIGDGQLGAMLCEAAYHLNQTVIVLDSTNNNGPATRISKTITSKEEFINLVDLITFESENIEVSEYLDVKDKTFYPPLNAVSIFQDRLLEKNLFQELAIPTTKFFKVTSPLDLQNAVAEIGFPAILKTRRQGYDGKGQLVLKSETDLVAANELIQANSQLIVEEFINYDREISIICASNGNEISCYPVSLNIHRSGILITSTSALHDQSQEQAENLIKKIVKKLNYQGIIALELFERKGVLIANECAPRVHNSGHWTLISDCSSQFENHLKGILGIKLGSTSPVLFAGIINILEKIPPFDAEFFGKIHLYGKSEAPKRKLGHINMLSASMEELENMIEINIKILKRAGCFVG